MRLCWFFSFFFSFFLSCAYLNLKIAFHDCTDSIFWAGLCASKNATCFSIVQTDSPSGNLKFISCCSNRVSASNVKSWYCYERYLKIFVLWFFYEFIFFWYIKYKALWSHRSLRFTLNLNSPALVSDVLCLKDEMKTVKKRMQTYYFVNVLYCFMIYVHFWTAIIQIVLGNVLFFFILPSLFCRLNMQNDVESLRNQSTLIKDSLNDFLDIVKSRLSSPSFRNDTFRCTCNTSGHCIVDSRELSSIINLLVVSIFLHFYSSRGLVTTVLCTNWV